MSKQKMSKSKKRGTRIILPRTPAAPASRQGLPLLSGQQSQHIQELIDLLKKNDLTELELEREGLRIRVRHEVEIRTITTTVADQGTSSSTSSSQSTGAASAPAEDTTGMITIPSPIVGTFYRSPSPDADPYVEEGDYVKKARSFASSKR